MNPFIELCRCYTTKIEIPLEAKNRPEGGSFDLFLGFFENNALSERGVEFRDLDFALDGLLVLARPDDVRRLRRLQFDKADLRHA